MYTSPSSIANSIRMKRSQYRGTFLLVEGFTDYKVYNRIIREEQCYIQVCFSKQTALEVLEILTKDNFQGVLAILDTDYWAFEQYTHVSNAKYYLTDDHDLECMILNSPALNKVLTEYGSKDKLQAIEQLRGMKIKDILICCALPIGYLRWLSLKYKYHLKFEELKFSQFIENDLNISIEKLVTTVLDKSNRFDLKSNIKNIENDINKLLNNHKMEYYICCGHDICEILSYALKQIIGTHGSSKINTNLIETSLRLAYEKEYFLNTHLYLSLCRWEDENNEYKVVSE